jgi:hypothetical protein
MGRATISISKGQAAFIHSRINISILGDPRENVIRPEVQRKGARF